MAIGVAGVSFGFLFPATSGVQGTARVFSDGLKVQLDRTSPAFAALEDAWMTDQSPEAQVAASAAAVPAIALNAGSDFAPLLAEKIARANLRERALINQERASREAQNRLYAQAAAEALKRMASQLRPMELAAHDSQPADAVETDTQAEVPSTTRTISLTDLRMSREELLGSLFLPLAQSAKSGARVAASVPQPGQYDPPVDNYSPPQWQRHSQNREEKTAGPSSADDMTSAQSVSRQVIVSGPIEFEGGLALTHAMDRLIVFREFDGDTMEAGAVWLREGRYEIFVEDTQGTLIGEVRTPYGDVMGRGTIELASINTAGRNGKVGPLPLRISPIPQGISGRVMAARQAAGAQTGIKGADIHFKDLPMEVGSQKDGKFEEPNFLEGSNAIVRLGKEGFWGTLAFAHTGSSNDLELFPDVKAHALRHLLALSRDPGVTTRPSAIIFGRVTRGGKPSAGAKVDLMTSPDPARPIYFNAAMIPDPKLTQTSENGYYAFFPVSPGTHAVQALVDGSRVTEPLLFPTEERMISKVDIEGNQDRRARVKVFDAFNTDRPLQAEVMNPGMTRGVLINGSGVGEVRYAEGKGLMILDTDAGRIYEKTRIAISRDRRIVYAPMIQTSWVESMRNGLGIPKEHDTGLVVGFVQGSTPYKVAMDDKSLHAQSKIVYFDNRGNSTRSDHGLPGGGFVIYNVPEGFRTITIQPSGTTKIQASVALVESKVTSVISHWIR